MAQSNETAGRKSLSEQEAANARDQRLEAIQMSDGYRDFVLHVFTAQVAGMKEDEHFTYRVIPPPGFALGGNAD